MVSPDQQHDHVHTSTGLGPSRVFCSVLGHGDLTQHLGDTYSSEKQPDKLDVPIKKRYTSRTYEDKVMLYPSIIHCHVSDDLGDNPEEKCKHRH